MGDVTMCHHHERTSWWTEPEEERADAEAEADDDWMPEEFEAERDVDVEILTDGGDE